MTNITLNAPNNGHQIPIPPTPPQSVLAYQKRQLLKQLNALDGALSNTYTVHQQRLGKLQREFNQDRKALTRQIVALREAIQQLGEVESRNSGGVGHG